MAPSAFSCFGRRVHQQADFPVAGVIPQRDGRAVGRADAAVRAENQEFLAAEFVGRPAHAGILRPAEDIAGRPRDQHLGRNRQGSRGSGNLAVDVVQGWVA